MSRDDRDELFGDAFDDSQRSGPDRWTNGEEGSRGEEPQPAANRRSVGKILLIVFALFLLGVVLCCGGAALIGWFAKPLQTTQNAAEITAKTSTILDITLPDEFHPALGMDMNMLVVQMQMVFYETPGRGVLMIAQAQGQNANEAQMQQQLRASMQQQNLGEPLTVKETETRTIAIDGNDVEFQFSQATNNNDNSAWRQVSGAFPGKNGVVILMLQQPDGSYDDAQVVEMLESIETK